MWVKYDSMSSHCYILSERDLDLSELAEYEVIDGEGGLNPHEVLVEALRVATRARIVHRGTILRTRFVGPSPGSSSFMRNWPYTSSRIAPDAVVVTEDGVREALEIADRRRRLKKYLHVPFRRFQMACDRDDDSDRLIDLAIAMESLLLGPVERNSLSFSFSMRGAVLLAAPARRRAKRKLLSEFYNRRSKTVHGDRPSNDETDVWFYAEEVRTALRRFVLAQDLIDIPVAFLNGLLLGDPADLELLETIEDRAPNRQYEVRGRDELWGMPRRALSNDEEE
jgi:hypothetical protein